MSFLDFFTRPTKRIYMDYAAATPVRPEVAAAMQPYFSEQFGNPGAIHKEGVVAREAIERAREELARTLRVRASDVTFTGSGTEANNLAVVGCVRNFMHRKGVSSESCEIITTTIEHPSVLETVRALKAEGVVVKYMPINDEGLIDVDAFAALLSSKTALVTFAYANSEIGVVQNVKQLTRVVRKFNTEQETEILVHLDAAQAPLWLPCQFDMLGVDMLTLDAGKCYGPKGVGVLARRHGVTLSSFLYGGGQEAGLRPGTENTPLIIGAVAALVHAQAQYETRAAATATIRNHFLQSLKDAIPDLVVNGSEKERIANNINISIPGIDAEFTVITLDQHGIAASTRSACSGQKSGGSYVVREISGDESRATSTVRFTIGEDTTSADVLRVVQVLQTHVEKMGQLAPVSVT